MFYVKTNDITNVFANCPECGTEHPVNLSQILKNELSDLTNTDIMCKHCTEKPPIVEDSPAEENSRETSCDIMRKRLIEQLDRLLNLFEKDLSPEDTVMVSTEIRKIYRDFWSY